MGSYHCELDVCGDDALGAWFCKDSRGWAMRKGHGKRLCRDDGRESQRGRTAFARSLGKSKNGCQEGRLSHGDEKAMNGRAGGRRNRDLLAETLRAAEPDCLSSFGYAMVRDDLLLFPTAADEARRLCEEASFDIRPAVCKPSPEPVALETQQDVEGACNCDYSSPPPPRLLRLRSEPVTRREVHTAATRAERVVMPLPAWAPHILCKVATGEIAIQLATPRCLEQEHDEHCSELSREDAIINSAGETNTKPRRRRRERKEQTKHQDLVESLPRFKQVQKQFLDTYGEKMHEVLKGTKLADARLSPAPVTIGVQKRFLAALHARGTDSSIIAAWHGTRKAVHPSIFASGLRIPGGSNGLRVVHGSAYGLGIYTAALNNPSLSCGYSDSKSLIACAIIDKCPREKVADHGNFLVTFDDSLIVPLFEACAGDSKATTAHAVSYGARGRLPTFHGKLKDGSAVLAALKLIELSRATNSARKQRREQLRKLAASKPPTSRAAAAAQNVSKAWFYSMRRAARKQHGVGSSQ
eukprot:TRINITY_DN16372_c0_g1_i2.p1 TRINITY_DN16372_c0_g1~~TRINITY_DN16372_c0_g1_i2.p1  ORF type:complete len:526 (-),score=88.00 TRINITY_DN16372_c0_g1_i2:360-1937(-)